MKNNGKDNAYISPSKPRILPKDFDEWDVERKSRFFERMKKLFNISKPEDFFNLNLPELDEYMMLYVLRRININLWKTIRNFPDLVLFLLPFANTKPPDSTLLPKERELVILRTGWLCHAKYECIHHIHIAMRLGISKAEIIRIIEGPDADGWDRYDKALLQAADELHWDYCISNETWKILSEKYTEEQRVRITILVGFYTKLAMFLNTLGVQVAYKHNGFGKLSNNVNNSDEGKKFYEGKKKALDFYENEILPKFG